MPGRCLAPTFKSEANWAYGNVQPASRLCPMRGAVAAIVVRFPGDCKTSFSHTSMRAASMATASVRLGAGFTEVQHLLTQTLCRYLAVLLFDFYADGWQSVQTCCKQSRSAASKRVKNCTFCPF